MNKFGEYFLYQSLDVEVKTYGFFRTELIGYWHVLVYLIKFWYHILSYIVSKVKLIPLPIIFYSVIGLIIGMYI
jgi:hypothetical protein